MVANLSEAGRAALLETKFNGRVWMLQTASAETTEELLLLKVVTDVGGILAVTNPGMTARAFVARSSRQRVPSK